MPAWTLPELDGYVSSDNELRRLAKTCNLLFLAVTTQPSNVPYPEGCRPLARDNVFRLSDKVLRLQIEYAIETAVPVVPSGSITDEGGQPITTEGGVEIEVG
jgi:hypothetical protein